jgi:7 transmembrane receptor (rhodopsin family)
VCVRICRTRARVAGMIAAVWLLSIAVSLPPLAGWKRPQPFKMGFPLCVLSEEPGYVIYSTVGSFYVPLIVIVVVYTKIYLAARSRARRRIQTAAAAAKMHSGSHKSTVASQTATAVSPSATALAAEESAGRVQRRKLPPDTLSIDCNPNLQQQHGHVRHSISVSTTISNLSKDSYYHSLPVIDV